MKMLIGAGLVLMVLIVVVLALPFLIDLNPYLDRYRPLIEEALNRKVVVKDIRLTLIPRLGARISGVQVLEHPAFGTTPFVSLGSLDVGVKLWPLFSGHVDVESITLVEPKISVVKTKDGVLNLSTLGNPAAPAPSPEPTPSSPAPLPTTPSTPLQILALLAVDQVTMTNGSMTNRDLTTSPATEYAVTKVNFNLSAVRLGQTPTLHLSAQVLPYQWPLTLDGTFGPLKETLELQHFDFTLSTGAVPVHIAGSLLNNQLDATLASPRMSTADIPMTLPFAKPVEIRALEAHAQAPFPLPADKPAMEVITIPSLKLEIGTGTAVIQVTGHLLQGLASVTATSPSIKSTDLPLDLPLKGPVEITNLNVAATIRGQEAKITKLTLDLFGGHLSAMATTTLGQPAMPFSGQVKLTGVQIGPALTALGFDQAKVSGTTAADIALKGRGFSKPELLSELGADAHLRVTDGRIEGVNLAKDLIATLNLAGINTDLGSATVFSLMEATVSVDHGTATVKPFLLDSHDVRVLVTGTVAAVDLGLNLKGHVTLSDALSQQIVGKLPLAKLAKTGKQFTLPLTVSGTAQAPVYDLDRKALTAAVTQQLKERVGETAKGAVQDLLQGKGKDAAEKGKNLLKDLFGREPR
jgi:uncharacterized protein involved in outer membrane biogenesis